MSREYKRGRVEASPVDAEYFRNYSSVEIHKAMLMDTARTSAYEQAILENPSFFKDKIVLDIGCGTGILSLFAWKSGAKHVYAVEASDLACTAREIVAANGADGVISVLKGRLEDITLPCEVDVIVSEWMGYFLYAFLVTVSHVKIVRMFLTRGGVVLPEKSTLFIAPFRWREYREEYLDFWTNVYGFNMDPMKKIAQKEHSKQVLVDSIPASRLISSPVPIKQLDIDKVSIEEAAAWKSEFSFTCDVSCAMVGFCVWFDVEFPAAGPAKRVVLSTSPFAQPTHWNQSLLLIPEEKQVSQDEKVSGKIRVEFDKVNDRALVVTLVWRVGDEESSIQTYNML